MNDLEQLLCVDLQREYSRIVGSGTIGLYLSLKALGLRGQSVAIPNNVCFNVPLAVILSGNSPLYVDIDFQTLSLSPGSLRDHIEDISAVVAVHGYGNMCDIESIERICNNRGIPLIEDCCLAQGANSNGKPAGSFGDISILSFGSSKIIEVGHGGAILTNDSLLQNQMIQIESKLASFSNLNSKTIQHLGSVFKSIYNVYYLDGLTKACSGFINEVERSKEAFLFKFSNYYLERIHNEVKVIGKNIVERRRNFEKIYHLLADIEGKFIDIQRPPKGSVIWRACFFAREKRNELFKFLLGKEHQISSWYPSIDLFMRKREDTTWESTPNSDWISDHIVNILINDKINDSYLKSISRDIIGFYNRASEG